MSMTKTNNREQVLAKLPASLKAFYESIEEEDRRNAEKIATFKPGDLVCMPTLDKDGTTFKFIGFVSICNTPAALLEYSKGFRAEFPLRFVEPYPRETQSSNDSTGEFMALLVAIGAALIGAAIYWK